MPRANDLAKQSFVGKSRIIIDACCLLSLINDIIGAAHHIALRAN